MRTLKNAYVKRHGNTLGFSKTQDVVKSIIISEGEISFALSVLKGLGNSHKKVVGTLSSEISQRVKQKVNIVNRKDLRRPLITSE